MDNTQKILVVDDEREIAELIEIHLKNEGYSVLKAYSGTEALEILSKQEVQLLILDIMMPGLNGLEVCRQVRREKNTPIIFLSAKSEDMDKIIGLSSGADDYMTKPFNLMELLARVKAQLRRYLQLNPNAPQETEGAILLGDLLIEPKHHRVTVNGQEIRLTPIEFGILQLLASAPGQVFSAEEIFSAVWNEKYYDSNNTVMVHIRKIRSKIESDPRNPRYLKTVWGIGYKLDGRP